MSKRSIMVLNFEGRIFEVALLVLVMVLGEYSWWCSQSTGGSGARTGGTGGGTGRGYWQ